MKLSIGLFVALFLTGFSSSTVYAQSGAKGLCEIVLFSGENFKGMLENMNERKGAIDKVKIIDEKGKKRVFSSNEIRQLSVKAINELTEKFEEVIYEHPTILPHKVKYQGLFKLLKSTDSDLIKVYSYEHGFKPYPKRLLHLVEGGVDVGMWVVNNDRATRFFKSTFDTDFYCFFPDYSKRVELKVGDMAFKDMVLYLDQFDADAKGIDQ